ncbi:unnamed protein product [Peniophora sp. CBMAI 1063]|nr:unnamed protein product [Peniophora sp. CBMAI 1063]
MRRISSGRRVPPYIPPPPDDRCVIDGLPNELLVAIFISVRDVCIEDPTEHGAPGWVLCLTHTCSRWRSAALSAQLLWAVIPRTLCFQWQQTFVARSGRALLQLSLQFHNTPFSSAEMISRTSTICDTIHTNLWRMDALWLLFPYFKGAYPKWPRYLDAPAPELRAFSMEAENTQSVELPPHLFQHHAPKLESIILNNIYFAWTQLAFSSLAVLKIYHTMNFSHSRDNSRNTVAEILALLARLPQLRWLELQRPRWSESLSPPSDPSRLGTISLPNLEVMKLYGLCEDIVPMMRYMDLPHTASQLLQLSGLRNPMALCDLMKSQCPAPVALAVKVSAEDFCLQFHFELPRYLRYDSGPGSSAPFTLEHDQPASVRRSETLWLRLATRIMFESFTFSQLTALYIDCASPRASAPGGALPFQAILCRTLALEELGLRGPALPEICKILSQPLERGQVVEGKVHLILPSLRRLTLWNVAFQPLVDAVTKDCETVYWDTHHHPVALDPDTLSEQYEEQDQEDLLEWIWADVRFAWILALRRRAEEWKPLKRLMLERCSGLPDWDWEQYLFGQAAADVISW